ncbi:MAG TPA: ABC transporter substrate-binding protein [Microbacterium sp.]|nr:ABC transporter substrate-binding protein [Microbacterium sp.]
MKRITPIPALVVGAASMLALTACGGESTTPQNSGDAAEGPSGAVNFAAIFQPTTWDPALGDFMANGFHYSLVYDTILTQNAAGELLPGIAEEWNYDDAQTTLTLDLRDGQAFTDGEPVDAAAIVANLEHYRDANGPGTAELALVESIEATGDDTVTVHFTAPDPSFLEDLATAVSFVVSPAAIEGGDLGTTPVGSGPYVLDQAQTSPGSKWAYAANPDTWHDLNYANVNVLIMDATAALNALKGGQIEVALLLDLQAADEAEKGGYARTLFSPSTVGIAFFDREGAITPELADVRVRQAINHAIDGEALVDAFLGGPKIGTPSRSLFAATSDAADPGVDSAYPYDPEKAKDLLAEAGYADGFTLTMPYVLNWGPGVPDAVKEQLAAVGITVEYDQLAPEEVPAAILAGKYAASLQSFGLGGGSWAVMTQQVPGNGAWNPLHVEDETAVGLMNDYQFAAEAERPEIAKELNAYITEEAWSNVWAHGHPSILSDPAKVTLPEHSVGLPPVLEWIPAS